MSYILDALKRADAERERTGVPGLHAQPDAMAPLRQQSTPSRWGRGLTLLAILALGSATLAWLWFSAATPSTPAPVGTPDRAAVSTVPAPVPKAQAAPGAEPEPPPAPLAARQPAPAEVVAALPHTESPKPAPPAAAHTDQARLYALGDLPADVRQALPALAVGGSMYSPSAAHRMVILNGQVFREGDQLAEGLSVEQIGLKATVLAFRGYRIELKH